MSREGFERGRDAREEVIERRTLTSKVDAEDARRNLPYDPNFDRAAACAVIIRRRNAFLGDRVGYSLDAEDWKKMLSPRELAEAVALMFIPLGLEGIDYSTFTGPVRDAWGNVVYYINGIAVGEENLQ